MASTYSNLKIQLMTTGENTTTWGAVTNTNLGTALEEAIVGSADVTFSNANTSISLSNTNASQAARNMRLNLTGTTGGSTRTLTVPDIEKVYIVNNTCADAVEVKNSSGSNVSVPAGKTTWVYSTGSNVVEVVTALTALEVGGSNVATLSATQTLTNKTLTAPTINDGALGANTTATTQTVSDNSTKVATTAFVQAQKEDMALTGTPTAPTAANAATSTTQIATTAFVQAAAGLVIPAGAVLPFARVAPAGWLFCNGTAVSRSAYASLFAAIGTTFGAGNGSTTFNLPDLRDEFIRGAGGARGLGHTEAQQTRWYEATDEGSNAPNFYSGGPYSGQFAGRDVNSAQNTMRRVIYYWDTSQETRPQNVSLYFYIKT